MSDTINSKAAARKAKSLASRMRRLADEVSDLRRELRESGWQASNSEQDLAMGGLMMAFDKAHSATSRLEAAARHFADSRTEDEIQAEQARLRAEERRERTIAIYGCAP